MSINIRFKSNDLDYIRSKTVGEYKSLKNNIKDERWLGNDSEKKAVLLANFLSEKEVENHVNVILTDSEREGLDFSYNFSYENNKKRVFIAILGQKWEQNKTPPRVYKCFKEVDKYEIQLGKSFINFNDQEVIETIRGLNNNNGFYGTKFTVKVLTRYEKLFSDNKIWKHYFSNPEFNKVIQGNRAKSVITQRQLFDLYDSTDNKQDYIVPILLFNGVRYSRIDDKDELRHLKKDDIKPDHISINHGDSPRTIDINNDVYKRLYEAIRQNFVVVNRFDREIVIELSSSDYLLRPINRKDNQNKVLSNTALNKRLDNVNDEIDNQFGVEGRKSQLSVLSGKKYFVDVFQSQGFNTQESIRKTLKRFGEWDFLDDGDGISLQSNQQRTARLKTLLRNLSK